MKRFGVLCVLAVLAGPAFAADRVCEQLGKAVDDGVKEMAFYGETALGASDAAVMSKKLDLVAEATKVQSNLMLMQANKCQMPREPIAPRAYFHSAFACAHTIPKSSADPIPECDRDKWVKSPK